MKSSGLAWLGGVFLIASATLAGSKDPVGLNGNNEFETPVNQLITPTGRFVELPGMRPLAIALSPDKKIVVTAGQSHELVALDPVTAKITDRVPFPDAESRAGTAPVSKAQLNPDLKAQISYTGLIFSPDGMRIYMANVRGDIKVFSVENQKIKPLATFPLPPCVGGRKEEIPAGLAISEDGRRLFVAASWSNQLLEMDAQTGRLLRQWPVGMEPYDVALAEGKAFVSNWAGRRPDKSSITGPGGSGTAVRVDALRHVPNEGSVSIIDLRKSDSVVEVSTGIHASALAVSPNEKYVVVANAGSDTLSVIEARSGTVVETISARQNPGDLFGAQPNALAFGKSSDLFVCNGTQNAVAVFRFDPGKSRLLGLIPVGWFPSAIAYDSRRKGIIVADLKGMHENVNKKYGRTALNSMDWHGAVSIVQIPNARDLSELTARALAAMRYPLLAEAALPARAGQSPRAVPERVGEPSLVHHVIYIIKENRTYDQVLGDILEANGDSALCIFTREITPNQHKLVHDFVLLDNTYCCGSRSPDGHQWADSALATDYIEKIFAGFPRSYPFGGEAGGADAMAYSPTGFIWDDALAHGKTLRDYGEFTLADKQWIDPKRSGPMTFRDAYRDLSSPIKAIRYSCRPTIETLRPYIDTNTIGWDLNVPDAFRAQQFIAELKTFEKAGNFPNLVVLYLPNDHTEGARPDSPTPAAMAADNDLAMGKVIEAVSHSAFWKDSCIFAIEDDPQSGWDHVSGYRTTAYLAGPYVKRNQIVSTQYNQTSLLRTMELMLGLPPMNQMDATATPMFDCFTSTPDFTPFDAVPNQIPLDRMNPNSRNISDRRLRRDAIVSAHLPFQKPDECPDDVLNRILWRAMKGTKIPYPEWAVKSDDDD